MPNKGVERIRIMKPSLVDRTCIIIPTWNAARTWPAMEKALRQQKIPLTRVLIVDSSSSDDTPTLVRRSGCRLKVIPKKSFGHGATRQLAAELLPNAEILVYLTQDALLCTETSLADLVAAFENPEVGACYGRQLSRPEAGALEQHARLFNYPEASALRTFGDRRTLGFRAAYFSNSFAAYRRVAFEQVGGFPLDTIVSEDVSVAARMLIAGWKVAYQADATVIHSHDFTLLEEFSRYFDIGVHHGRERWILNAFGHVGGEGKKFMLSEAQFLFKRAPLLLPLAVVRNANKWCGYQLGMHEQYLPHAIKVVVSNQKGYWRKNPRKHGRLRDLLTLNHRGAQS